MTTPKRKLAAGLVLTAVLISLFAFPAAAAAPEDIEDHWAQERIQSWLDQNLASGYPDGTFKPDEEVSRAEFVSFMNRAFKIPEATQPPGFDDVHEGDWHFDHVAAAVEEGLLSGYPDNNFQPDNPITREEAATIVNRLHELEDTDPGKTFPDQDEISGWASEAVNAVAAAGIMTGYPDGYFRPANPITRAEAISTLDRAMGFIAPPEPAVQFKVEPEELQMDVGEQSFIQVYVIEPPVDAVIEYESTDEAVATVDEEGLVTAEAEGEAEIIINVNAEGYQPSEQAVGVTVVDEWAEKYTVTFREVRELEGVEIEVRDGEELVAELETGTDGETAVELKDGRYNFTATKASYAVLEESFDVVGEPKTIEFELEEKVAGNFDALPSGTFQGQPLKVDFEEFVDGDGEYMEDGEYDIYVELAYSEIDRDDFTVENVFFTDGQAHDVVILEEEETLVEAHHLEIYFTIEGAEAYNEYVIDQEIGDDTHIVRGSGTYRDAEEEIVFEAEAIDLVGDRITHQFVEVDGLFIANEDVTQQASAEWGDGAWKITVTDQDRPADEHEFELSILYEWSGKVVELEPISWMELEATGVIEGQVVDREEQEPIENADIEVNEIIFENATDEEGKYRAEVAAGMHDVTARKGGYATDTKTDVEVSANEITEGINFSLAPYELHH